MIDIDKYKNKIILGDALEVLKTFPDECIDCVITSPPYWGLRDYQVEGQIGLESTLEEYLEKLLKITAEIKRVLKPTGVVFWVHGDCYGGNNSRASFGGRAGFGIPREGVFKIPVTSKCLALQNFRLLIRLVDEQGWILRNIIIWHKTNNLPSSVKDRFTNSYEPIFFFVKSKEKSNDIKIWLDKPLKKHLASWLAAIIDVEGTIGIRRSRNKDKHDVFGPYITVSNSCKEIVEKCFEITHLGTIRKDSAKTNFEMYRWEVTHQKAITIIGEIYPYLIQKREQAKVLIALQKTNIHRGNNKGENRGPRPISEKEYQEKIKLWELAKKLNQREIKESGLPEPNLNRIGSCEKYYFNLDAVRIPWKQVSIERYKYPVGLLGDPIRRTPSLSGKRVLLNLNKFNYRVCDTKKKSEQCSQFKAMEEEIEKYKRKVYGEDKGNRSRVRAGLDAYKKRLTYNEYMGISPTGLHSENSYHLLGKNPGDVLDIATCPAPKEVRGKHFATFPEKLIEPMIKAGCPEGGLILDPFMGSGTVGVVAKKLGRNFIGIELNPEYVEVANERLKKIPETLF